MCNNWTNVRLHALGVVNSFVDDETLPAGDTFPFLYVSGLFSFLRLVESKNAVSLWHFFSLLQKHSFSLTSEEISRGPATNISFVTEFRTIQRMLDIIHRRGGHMTWIRRSVK